MKVQLAHILENLFQTPSLDEVPVERLQEIAKDHPYFSTVQFLLAQKLKENDPEQYGTAVQKTALYFHDPLWLHWQLDQEKKEIASPPAIEIAQPAVIEEEVEPLTDTPPIEHSEPDQPAETIETI